MATRKKPASTAPIQSLDDALDKQNSDIKQVVSKVQKRNTKINIGKPTALSKSVQRARIITASTGSSFTPSGFGGAGGGYAGVAGYGGYGGFGGGGGFGGSGLGTIQGSGGNFYSPELSSDFLELPQSLDEQRNTYRFFYDTDPFVGQAIDIHSELPLSKIRIGMPRVRTKAYQEMAAEAMRFCENWSERMDLMHRLIEITHEYNLIGEVFIYVEDENPEMPKDVMYEEVTLAEGDEIPDDVEEVQGVYWRRRADWNERGYRWMKKNYKGWTGLQVIPPEKVDVRAYPFTREKSYHLVFGKQERDIYEKALNGDPEAKRIVSSMPRAIVEALALGENTIILNTDPDEGSFLIHMSRKRSPYDARGRSILQRCIRTLVHRDKIRQALAMVASRHMTPIRVVTFENGDINDIQAVREQIDLALMDPDHSIITNFPLEWNEMGADQRIPDWSSEFERTNQQLYAGMGVTESLLSGESSYSGDRINLEVINTRYLLFREIIQNLVEKKLFMPMCKAMGFIQEHDGERDIVFPPMSFTRLALRDNSDTYDHLFNLYTKGSLSVSTIYDLLGLDPTLEHKRIEEEFMTLRDANFNEAVRGAYGELGRMMAEKTDMFQKLIQTLHLKEVAPPDERF